MTLHRGKWLICSHIVVSLLIAKIFRQLTNSINICLTCSSCLSSYESFCKWKADLCLWTNILEINKCKSQYRMYSAFPSLPKYFEIGRESVLTAHLWQMRKSGPTVTPEPPTWEHIVNWRVNLQIKPTYFL